MNLSFAEYENKTLSKNNPFLGGGPSVGHDVRTSEISACKFRRSKRAARLNVEWPSMFKVVFFLELESLSFDCPKKKKKVYPLIEKKNAMAQKLFCSGLFLGRVGRLICVLPIAIGYPTLIQIHTRCIWVEYRLSIST